MFRPFLNSLMLGSLFFPFIAIAGSTAQGGVIHFNGQIVEPACDVSTQSSPVEMNCPQNGSVPRKTYSSKALMSGNVKWSTKTGHRVRVFPVSIFRFVWG